MHQFVRAKALGGQQALRLQQLQGLSDDLIHRTHLQQQLSSQSQPQQRSPTPTRTKPAASSRTVEAVLEARQNAHGSTAVRLRSKIEEARGSIRTERSERPDRHPLQRNVDCESGDQGAAASGRLQIVKWLSENRREGCTTRAMDGAAAVGSLDVVRWLHEHRTEGCTAEAMNAAAGEGHLHVVRWLFNNRTENNPTYAYRRAALHGRNDIVKWIRKRIK